MLIVILKFSQPFSPSPSPSPSPPRSKFPETNVVKKIVETIKSVHRERISRVAIATLRNLAEASHTSCLHIVEGGFMKVLPNLLLRKWGDEELENNLQVLDEILQRVMSELGSWDRYKGEVMSGNLELVFLFIYLFLFHLEFFFLFFFFLTNPNQTKLNQGGEWCTKTTDSGGKMPLDSQRTTSKLLVF